MYVILLKSFCRYKAINGAHGHETLRAERFVPLRGGYKKVASQKKLTRERKICAASRSSSAVYPELIGKIYVSDAISKRSTPPLVKDHCGLLSLYSKKETYLLVRSHNPVISEGISAGYCANTTAVASLTQSLTLIRNYIYAFAISVNISKYIHSNYQIVATGALLYRYY